MAEVTILSIGSDSFSKSLLVDVLLSHTLVTICSEKKHIIQTDLFAYGAPFLLLTKIDNQLGDAKVKQKMKMTWSKWVIGKSNNP